MKKNTYRVESKCKNCGWQGKIGEEKGIEFNEKLKECPNCECYTLAVFLSR